MTDPAISLSGLQKVIGQSTVIDIPSLEVKAGEIVAAVGPDDSGRDALFRLLTGAIRPTTGRVLLAGLDPFNEREAFSRQVGIVFPEDNLYKRMSAIGNLRFYCRLYKLPAKRAADTLELVGLADHAEAKLQELPSGLLRRLAFGRAILHEPSVLLLAEPFARSDEATLALLVGVIRQQAANGAAVFILDHDQTALTSLCDVIYALKEGRLGEVYLPREEPRPSQPFKIPVRVEDKVVLVNPADILFADASEGRAFLVTAEGRLPTQYTLSELEGRLARSGFFRGHRSYLVNLQHIKEVIPYTRNSFSLRLDDAANTEIPLSKSAAHELRALLGY
jgi:ABC-2 type transport system ATP-binding protein